MTTWLAIPLLLSLLAALVTFRRRAPKRRRRTPHDYIPPCIEK